MRARLLLCNYAYDPTGNMLSILQNGVNTTFTYGSNNQLLKMGNVNFTYDSNGNMLTMVNGSQAWQYGYDYENRLVNVSLNSPLLQTNLYSSNG